jgi:hypothetical protein
MSYHMSGQALGDYNKCLPNAKDLDTKAGREAAAKATAACAADAGCAYYGVPPGVCGPIAGKIAGVLVDVWNDIWGDDAHERAVLQAQTVVPYALSQLYKLDFKFKAYYFNAAARLIDLNDQLLPAKKGALGGGIPSTVNLVGETKYIAAYKFPYKNYPKNRPAMERLTALGAPPAACSATSTWCSPPSLREIDAGWRAAHATAGSIVYLNQIKSLTTTYTKWMAALAVAEASAIAEITAQAAKSPTYSPAVMAKVLTATSVMNAANAMSPVTKTVVVAGAAGLLWWVGKKFLF